MRIKVLTWIFLLGGTGAAANAQGLYDVAKIPAELVKDATTVVRNEERSFTVKSLSNATLSYKTAVTILNSGGDSDAEMSEYYDNFSSVYNLKATIYDAKGNKIKSYKTSDFKDQSITDGGTMFDSFRMKQLVFLNTSYPYTLEYSYDKDFDGYLGYTPWVPVSSYHLSVQKSSFTLTLPADTKFRYLKSDGLKTDSALLNNKIVYKWNCQNFAAIESEPYSTGVSTITPWVKATPDQFEYDHSKGSVDSWKNWGTWIYQLTEGTQVLPETTVAAVKTLIANAKNDKEKISILYKYLQSNTRYVSVQLGIGGFKPIASAKVAAVNYGDCKALSNYMQALLNVAGIHSELVILGNDMPSLNTAFPSFGQTNHAILCVPAAKDTTWLECTSQHSPLNFLGSGSSDRLVLLATAEGGKLVRTPVYKPEDNFQNRLTTVALTAEGLADISIKTDYGFCQYYDNLGMLLKEPTDQKKSVMNSLGLPNMNILSLSYLQPDPSVPKLEEKISLKSSQMFSNSADKMFLTLNLLNRKESVPRKVENRRTPFALPYGFKDMDQVIYSLPAGYKVEFVPKDILLESEFGTYTAKAVVKDNTIVYTRSQMINSRKYAPEKYKDLVDFYKKIYLADKQKAILAKIN